ncbi:MAG TPA: hypothetical protein VIZ63_02935, partial [Povalibacter sp.]
MPVETAADVAKLRVRSASRQGFIDVFRGSLIAHMALDHASLMFYAGRGAEELAASAPAVGDFWQFLTRFTGVPVAPGFFFMAGFMGDHGIAACADGLLLLHGAELHRCRHHRGCTAAAYVDAGTAGRLDRRARACIFAALAILSRLAGRGTPVLLKPLEIFGRVPFFFYVVHFYVLGIAAALLRTHYGLVGMYFIWGVVAGRDGRTVRLVLPIEARPAQCHHAIPVSEVDRQSD